MRSEAAGIKTAAFFIPPLTFTMKNGFIEVNPENPENPEILSKFKGVAQNRNPSSFAS